MKRKAWIASAAPVVLILLATFAFVVFEPIQVLPRLRVAPGFALIDQSGESLTSEDLRGHIVLYAFGYTRCGEDCERIDSTVREVRSRLDEVDVGEDTEIRFVTISFDPEYDSPEALADYAAEVGADGEQWVFTTTQAGQAQNVVTAGFKTWFEDRGDGTFAFDPAYVLVDTTGVIRGDYRYRTNATDSDRIVRQIGVLGSELRNSYGAAGWAYEAAHLFACYP